MQKLFMKRKIPGITLLLLLSLLLYQVSGMLLPPAAAKTPGKPIYLFIGQNGIISLSASGYRYKNGDIIMNFGRRCHVKKLTDDSYSIKPDSPECNINVPVYTKSGERPIRQQLFKIRYFPELADIEIGHKSGIIRKREVDSADGLHCYLPDEYIADGFDRRILGYGFAILPADRLKDGNYKSAQYEEVQGWHFTPSFRQKVRRAGPCDMIFINDIRILDFDGKLKTFDGTWFKLNSL
jgi:hypothetical protein